MRKFGKKTLNIIEGLGLILILATAFIQQYENEILDSKQEFDYAKLHVKLDALWAVTSHQYQENHAVDSTRFWLNFPSYLDKWKIYSEQASSEDAKLLRNDIKTFGTIQFVLFCIGSLMLILPKFFDN